MTDEQRQPRMYSEDEVLNIGSTLVDLAREMDYFENGIDSATEQYDCVIDGIKSLPKEFRKALFRVDKNTKPFNPFEPSSPFLRFLYGLNTCAREEAEEKGIVKKNGYYYHMEQTSSGIDGSRTYEQRPTKAKGIDTTHIE